MSSMYISMIAIAFCIGLSLADPMVATAGATSESFRPTRFENNSGKTIMLGDAYIDVGHLRRNIANCSDETFFCMTDGVSFAVVLPKRCKDMGSFNWSIGLNRTRPKGIVIDPLQLMVVDDRYSNFGFLYYPRKGIVAIYFDNSGDGAINEGEKWESLPFEQKENYTYYRRSASPLFACA